MHTSFPQLVKSGSRFLANNSKHFGSFGRYSLNISVERIVNIQYNSYAVTTPVQVYIIIAAINLTINLCRVDKYNLLNSLLVFR